MIQALLNSVFSDETELFRSPSEPDPRDTVTIRLRLQKNRAKRVMLVTGEPEMAMLMRCVQTDETFDWYESKIVCLENRCFYNFVIETDQCNILYQKTGTRVLAQDEKPDREFAFCFTPGFHVPEWAKGAVQYQIMVDRFCNGNKNNDVTDNEY